MFSIRRTCSCMCSSPLAAVSFRKHLIDPPCGPPQWTFAPAWCFPWAAGQFLLWHLEEHLPSLFSDLGAYKAVPHTFFSLLTHCTCSILPFLKHIFPKVRPLWLRGSAMSHGGSAGAGWDRPCPARAATVAPHSGPCAQGKEVSASYKTSVIFEVHSLL